MNEHFIRFERLRSTLPQDEFFRQVEAWCLENRAKDPFVVDTIEKVYLGKADGISSIKSLLISFVPGVETDVQANLFVAAFQALCGVFGSINTKKKDEKLKYVEALHMAIAGNEQIAWAVDVLAENPEAANSIESHKLRVLPEETLCAQLKDEILTLKNIVDFKKWWDDNRWRTQKLNDLKLRDEVFNTLRAHLEKLS